MATLVLSALTLEVDGTPLRAQLGASQFSRPRSHDGVVRARSGCNRRRRSRACRRAPISCCSATATTRIAASIWRTRWCPASDAVAVTAQRRDGDQTELTIDYVLRAAPATPRRRGCWAASRPRPCCGSWWYGDRDPQGKLEWHPDGSCQRPSQGFGIALGNCRPKRPSPRSRRRRPLDLPPETPDWRARARAGRRSDAPLSRKPCGSIQFNVGTALYRLKRREEALPYLRAAVKGKRS